MNFGIKRKVLLVLVGALAFTSALDALLASYYTNRQNQESAFADLSRDLLAWQNDLHALTLRLRSTALATVGDSVVLNQLDELLNLEVNVDNPWRAQEIVAMGRTSSYTKTVSLNRLHLVLRTGSFSSIAVYTRGTLSHFISASEAGMMARRGNTPPVWVRARADANGRLDFQTWPAWQEGRPPSATALVVAPMAQPTVSVVFPSPEFAAIEIAVPLQGIVEELWSDLPMPMSRVVLGLAIAGAAQDQATSQQRRETVAVLVFRKLIDRHVLDQLAAKTGKWPLLFSPDGSHRQRLTDVNLTSNELLRKAQAIPPGSTPQVIRQTVRTEQGSFYQALLPWQFENRTRLVLGLMSSRASTLQNIRETVTAILASASLILVISMGVGIFWVGRLIDPIIALTKVVKQMGAKRRLGDSSGTASDQLQLIAIEAPDEIGELSSAFNVMTAELRHAFETLEQRVQTRTAELRQQTRYLRTLIDTLPVWVWIKDMERRYLATNQANAEACGHTVDEMVGKADEELWPRELAERYCADDVQVMASRQRSTVEESMNGPDGLVWMETYRAPVLDEDGTVLGTVGVARNISEGKAAEAAREAALAEAVRLARQRSEFLAQMSHELRTPLNAIMGYAQLLRRDTKHLAEQQARGLEIIQESGQHLLTLINDILDLARVEAGKLALYPAAVNLPDFMWVVVNIIRVKAEEKSLLFTYQDSPDLPASITVDDKRLRQVLLNLLGNAVKFTDSGEISLRVHSVAMHQPQGEQAMVRLRFEVQDSGIGMSEEQVSRIFQAFEQVAEVRRREGGTGLGLAISQQLVHLMGGDILVDSRLGKGSLFWFELELPLAAAPLAALPKPRAVIGYEGLRKKVLVVDDVPQNRAMLMDALQALGFYVIEAENGQECLDMLDSARPDLILMDFMMPVMDGGEATRRIRNLPEFARIPIIITSASVSHDDELKSQTVGANAFLPKPIEQASLLKTIGEGLGLNWINEEIPQEAVGEGEREALDLIIPPQDEIEALCQLARLGDMQKISARADYLIALDSRYAAFAKQLRTLAQGYQSKAIAALVERHRTGHKKAGTESSSFLRHSNL